MVIKRQSIYTPNNNQKKDMKYKCKSCKTKCNDITEHIRNVHKFTEWIMELQLKTNPNTYKSCFEVLE